MQLCQTSDTSIFCSLRDKTQTPLNWVLKFALLLSQSFSSFETVAQLKQMQEQWHYKNIVMVFQCFFCLRKYTSTLQVLNDYLNLNIIITGLEELAIANQSKILKFNSILIFNNFTLYAPRIPARWAAWQLVWLHTPI